MSTALIMTFTGSLPTAPSNAIREADLQYGSNGDPYGTPELGLGHGSSFSAGRIVWDNSGSDEFESLLVPVDFVVPAGGGSAAPSTLSVSGATDGTVSYQGSSYSNIGSVVIDTATQINGFVGWSNLTISFLHNGTVFDSWASSSGAQVDTTNAAQSLVGQQITVTPSSFETVTSVEITGEFSMNAPAGSYPDSNDLFSDIFIMGAM